MGKIPNVIMVRDFVIFEKKDEELEMYKYRYGSII